MRAVVISEGRLDWLERPDPVPASHEICVAVRAAGLNGADLLQRRGRYRAPAGSPQEIPGLEMAGEVVALGAEVSRFGLGDRVMALLGGGAQAELAVIDERHAMRAPESITWSEAGAFPETFCTAHDALFAQCGLSAQERVLITGAAGGVGTAAVQLASLRGAKVIAAVRDAEHRVQVGELGADEVIDPAEIDRHGPYDVVLELVGAASLPAALGQLAKLGRVAVIGVGSGARVELDLSRLMVSRGRIGGSTLRSRTLLEKAEVIERIADEVLPYLTDGRLRVPIWSTFGFDDAQAAYDCFDAGGKLGKVVLIDEPS
ncbi:MAG: zinc-binding dehydrogenase [Acidimicrobiales bacterium]